MAKKKSQSYIDRNKIVMLIILIFGFLIANNFQTVPSYISIKQEKNITKLPPEIKKQLEQSAPSATFRIPILMYHYVEYVKDPGDTIRKSLDIVPFVFENQVKTLKEAGYTFITPSQLARVIDGKEEFPPKPIILSFDDGYKDFYDDVFPILKKYNIKAVDYVISGFLNHPNFMYSWEVTDISKSGLVEIGAHTVHHVYLKGVSKQIADYEIKESKKMLEGLTGSPVVSFAYPSGAFDLQAEEIVKEAGFKTAVSTVPGIEASDRDRFFLYRIRPGARMGNDLLNYLAQNTFKAF